MEPEDLELIYSIENDPEFWRHGSTTVPYSRYVLRQYLQSASNDLFADQQVRLVIEGKDEQGLLHAFGLADLTNFAPQHLRAEIALAILPQYQGLHIGEAAIHQLVAYARRLRLHQLYAIISVTNKPASRLFQHLGFEGNTILKDWLQEAQGFTDARLWRYTL